MSITILLFGHNVSFKRYWQFKIIWFPLSCHHSNRTISLSHKRCIHNSHIKYENALKYIYPLNEIVSLSRWQGDHESQGDNFESLRHCWYYLDPYPEAPANMWRPLQRGHYQLGDSQLHKIARWSSAPCWPQKENHPQQTNNPPHEGRGDSQGLEKKPHTERQTSVYRILSLSPTGTSNCYL